MSKLKNDEFRCLVCLRIIKRGVYVVLKPTHFKVKICKRDDCLRVAKHIEKLGDFTYRPNV